MTPDPSRAAATDVVALVTATPPAQALRRRLAEGGAFSWPEVAAPAWPFVTALLHRWFPDRAILAVTSDLKAQETFHQDLQTWLAPFADNAERSAGSPSPATPLFFPAWEVLPHSGQLPHADVISERLETLLALAAHARPEAAQHRGGASAPIVVASLAALLQRTFPPAMLRGRLRTLRRDDTLDPLDLIEWLEDQAYEPEAQATQKGEIALRGGIVDVYPLTSPWPVRLEFFGNTLESLRFFDPQTQISREEIGEITLAPAGELGILRALVDPAVGPSPAATTRRTASAVPVDPVQPATLLDHLPADTLVVLGDPAGLAVLSQDYQGQLPAHDPFSADWAGIQSEIAARGMTRIELADDLATRAPEPPSPRPAPGPEPAAPPASETPRPPPGSAAEPPASRNSEPDPVAALLRFISLDAFRPVGGRAPEPAVAEAQRRAFFAQVHRWLRQGHSVEVFCNNAGEQQRFGEIWQELGMAEGTVPTIAPAPAATAAAPPAEPTASPPSRPATASGLADSRLPLRTRLGTLARGFLCEAARLVVVTDAEIFGRYKIQRPRRLKSPHAAAVRSALDIDFTDLEEGDYVVHLQHGIGRYLGLQRLAASPNRAAPTADASPTAPEPAGEECLVIEYAPSIPGESPPKLYVPVTESQLVSKYVGAGKARPPLNSLSGTRWAKAKAQASEAVRDFAAELLRLQAARAAQPGFAFPADAPWQREFESAFLYEETPDQLRAIDEAKRDLEAPRPMDRLICGDVGFGKTEVAIRAAFKTVLAGKQVAILVPTTVLAQQHYNTFRERMADYPIRVELLSRFRTRRQQDRVVQDLAVGAVDIVIGTHRLVQSDVTFKDLGLVVIDEEQRFGVGHKERLKQLRQLVDVLTLSATPIPRTLYLALTGARDMSTIETPPQDRLPIETIIAAYDERLIRDAIQRELNRGGQVFFLHNRVLDIDTVALKLRQLVPAARLAVGHGQMHADDLEDVMARFINGEVDVLLSTTIIESGIDIPNANTIIIDRADRFGLSDLYQLRGRVGRYKHQAYAYLLIPRHAGLLADARKRISAIRQFSSPGSGFKIAMRDLEIRGAGNLLGLEQSGHITAVGFELYCRLLKHSIAALKGEPIKPQVDVSVRLDFLDLSPVVSEDPPPPERRAKSETRPPASAPPEDAGHAPPRAPAAPRAAPHLAPACLPLTYVPEPHHRIEMYRKLAQATDKAELEAVRAELRDRFGPFPAAVELLLQVTALKILAADRGVRVIETRDDRLMLTRGQEFVQVGGKFPRLTKRTPQARLKEIRTVLVAL